MAVSITAFTYCRHRLTGVKDWERVHAFLLKIINQTIKIVEVLNPIFKN